MEGNLATVAKKIVAVVIIILGLIALYNNLFWFMRYIYPLNYQESIVRYSAEHGVDPYLVISVIKVESNFSPKVVSKKNHRAYAANARKQPFGLQKKME